MTSTTFDTQREAVAAGQPLSAADIEQLAAAADILPIGMLADEARRHLHGTRVTYVRVAQVPYDGSLADHVLPPAGEVRLLGTPPSLDVARTAVSSARAVAGERPLSAFAWSDVASMAVASGLTPARVLSELRGAGLDALADLPLDDEQVEAAVEALVAGGFSGIRLTMRKAAFGERQPLFAKAEALQRRFGGIEALSPLPHQVETFRPTTGYEDVKTIALARLVAPSIRTIQVDWLRYGPKLAQVALTFGANDLDAVGVSDESPDGRRRAPLEEVRRNIEAAGFTPVERDGRFVPVA